MISGISILLGVAAIALAALGGLAGVAAALGGLAGVAVLGLGALGGSAAFPTAFGLVDVLASAAGACFGTISRHVLVDGADGAAGAGGAVATTCSCVSWDAGRSGAAASAS